jgi:hypothetical protein
MSRFDMLNPFVTRVVRSPFARPGGFAKGEYLAQALFQA